MEPEIRAIELGDHEALMHFWSEMPGVSIGESDALEPFAIYLRRNPGSNFLAEYQGRIIGTALGAHDGRRGMLRHVAVAPDWRHQGFARALVNRCLAALAAEGISKSYIIVFADNEPARRFWRHLGWESSDEFLLMWGTHG